MKTLKVKTRQEWREWLAGHHEYVTEVWLVYSKVKPGVGYEETVEEALCFGWVDSLIRRIDDRQYARKFTPRKPDSRWSDLNRKRWAKMKEAGLLAPAGERLAPTEKRSAPPRDVATVPPELASALARNAKARTYFEQLAPSCRRLYIGWITAAKMEQTRERRVREAVEKLARGEKLGLK